MKPYYSDQGVTLLNGDVRDALKSLPDESFNCCVTSPPYFGLRDYGTAQWEGGDAECDHRLPATGGNVKQGPNKGNNNAEARPFRERCGLCGALRIDRQLGLESTPDEYVANMVAVFREVRRCLTDAGVLFVNVGDSYNAYNGGRGPAAGVNKNHHEVMPSLPKGNGLTCKDLKPKDLIGIPWLLAFALRADGWYLRSDIIWAKGLSFCESYSGSVMPESVRDRPTKAHEYLFLLSKSDRYYFDADAIKERSRYPDDIRAARETERHLAREGINRLNPETAKAYSERNVRSVWAINTSPYPGAHFATFPEDLVKPCILAGSPAGGAVLEPFCGSGTTLKVARDLGRTATGVELNPEYCRLTVGRLAQGVLWAAGGAA